MPNSLQINMSFDWIQQIRLVHALTESDFDISLPQEEGVKFDLLKKKFGIRFAEDGPGSIDLTGFLETRHAEPLTSVGDLARHLIFPHDITDYCRSLWVDPRTYRYSFQGLLTKSRKSLMNRWVSRNIKGARFRLKHRLWRDVSGTVQIGDLVLRASDRGRQFPIKAWDEAYHRMLANSQFVLCPSGDCVWSYRFFESVLCGAVPIIEKQCDAYRGFQCYSVKDAADEMQWSMKVAESNYELCVDRLTVPKAALNSELARIFEGGV